MSLSPKKFLVLAKTEVTQFTDPTATAGANSILVKNPKFSPLKVETEDRGLVKPYFGNSEQILVNEEAVVEFDVEVAGSSTPLGTAAKYGPLLKACGFAETLTASTKVEYDPISASITTVYLKVYRDGLLYQFAGCAGNVTFNFAAKKLPFMHFTFTGKYVAVSDASIPGGADYSGFVTPVASIPAKMGTITIGGYAAKMAEFTVDMGNEVNHALWMNLESLQITDRKPKAVVSVELPLIATKDYFTLIRNATSSALVFTQGVTTGNIVAITAPALTLSDFEEYEYEGFLAAKMNAVLNPSSGNDEIKITLT